MRRFVRDSLVKARDNSDIEKLRAESKVTISLKLEQLLQSWNRVFTKMRYAYQVQNDSYVMIFVPEIVKVKAVETETYRIDGDRLCSQIYF